MRAALPSRTERDRRGGTSSGHRNVPEGGGPRLFTAGTHQPTAAARRSQARGRARPAHDAGVHASAPPGCTARPPQPLLGRARHAHGRHSSGHGVANLCKSALRGFL
eukprot:scaffold82507_cov72-Phaeocystis_antarctica.AAC.7